MRSSLLLITGLVLLTLFASCRKEMAKPKTDYNQEANALIKQIVLDESCDCILEMPKESMIAISKNEHTFDPSKQIIATLHLSDRKQLDSLEKLTTHFILDTVYYKRHNITVFKSKTFRKEIDKDPSSCPHGILCIKKPIFDKDYKHAVVNYGYAFMCLSSPMSVYTFKNGKWRR